MSRGFVKEDDQEEIPMVPPRADLPEGVTNYVTQVGMDELLIEKQELINEREHLDISNEKESRIASNYINAKLQLLKNRIATAKIVDLNNQPKNIIRFGALVTLKISKGKIAFISPIARLLINKKVGEKAVLKLAKEDRYFKIINIKY